MARGQAQNPGAIQAVKTGPNTFKVLDWGNSQKDPSVGIVFKDAGQLSEQELSVMTGDARPGNEWDTATSAASVASGGVPAQQTAPQQAAAPRQQAVAPQQAAAPQQQATTGGEGQVFLPVVGGGAPAPIAGQGEAFGPPMQGAGGQAVYPQVGQAAPAEAQNMTPVPAGQVASAVPQSPFFQNMSVADAAANPDRMNLQAINRRIQLLETQQAAAAQSNQTPAGGVQERVAPAREAPKGMAGQTGVADFLTPDTPQQFFSQPPQGLPAPPQGPSMPMPIQTGPPQYPGGYMAGGNNVSPPIPPAMPVAPGPVNQAQPPLVTDEARQQNIDALNALLGGVLQTQGPGWNSTLGQ